MPKSYRLAAWDCLNFLTKRFSDQQVRFVIELDGRLDESRLTAAVRLAVEAEPLLSCRMRDRYFRPRWEPIPDLDARSLWRVFPTMDSEAEVLRLIREDLDPQAGPIVRVGLVRAERDTLVINLDHTAGDAASVRSLAYLLASAYTHPELCRPPEDRAGYFRRRDLRSLRPAREASEAKAGAKLPLPSSASSWHFPWEIRAGELSKRLLLRRLSAARTRSIQEFAASRRAWLNDVLLACYFRALDRLLGPGAGEPRFIVPVDLRSYLPARERPRVANFSSTIDLALARDLGRSLEDTLALVCAATRREKSGSPGLSGARSLARLLDRIPFRIVANRFRSGKMRVELPPPWFLALGVIRPERLTFGAVAPRGAYSLPSFSRAGMAFQLSASTFSDSLALAVCFIGDDDHAAVVDRFLDAFESELPS